MSNNAEDLYLKGFMAFSAKNYSSAKAYWEQTLAADPNHEKAKKGLADLAGAAKPKKKSSKEVFQDIKRLYSEKNFAEALRLCNLLLKKHPTNTDLQGLQKKLEARVTKEAGAAAPVAQQAPEGAKSTMYMATAAEASVEDGAANQAATADDGEDVADKVARFIQEGVGAYEVQDYAAAISAWEKAVALDPDNRIARDYISNVQSLMEPQEEPEPAPDAFAPGKPSKEDMIRIYNEAMALYKEGDFTAALVKWESILAFHPTHTETLQCVERTKQMLASQQISEVDPGPSPVDEARGLLGRGKVEEAERIATELAITAPNTPGLDELQEELRSAKRAAAGDMDAVSSLEIDAPAASEPREVIRPDVEEDHHTSHSASDDQLGEFFAQPKDTTIKARQVSKVVKARKERKPLNLKLIIGVPLILVVLGGGGWFGWDYYNKMLKTNEEDTGIVLARDVHWNSIEQQSIDFLEFGNEFADSGDVLMAAIAYQRVIDIVDPRLSQVLRNGDPLPGTVEAQEVERLTRSLDDARAALEKVNAKIVPAKVTGKDMERAQAELDRERYRDAVVRLHNILSTDRDNVHLRDKLGDTHELMAFKALRSGDLDGAYESFKRATVLQSGNDKTRHHTEVIQLFYQGKITAEDKDQWFFFFIN